MEKTSSLHIEFNGNTSVVFPPENLLQYDTIVSNDALEVLQVIFFATIIAALSIVGLAANAINIIIFCKQGFSDSVNISVCALAVSDLGSLLTLLWMSVCFNPLVEYADIDIDSVQVQHITAGWPHGCFVWITSWITAFVNFERCVCIALPMKVKNIITPKRTLIAVGVIFVTMFASVSPVYCGIGIAPTFNDQHNRTMYGLMYSRNGEHLENISSSINIVTQISCLIIVIVCTAALIYNLRSNSQWRSKVTSCSLSSNSNPVSKRDKRVIKMVTLLSCIFIACYFPSAINIILMVIFSPDYGNAGRYRNSFLAVWAIFNTIEAVNSSVTIIVYYRMSSKFRARLMELFRIKTLTVKEI